MNLAIMIIESMNMTKISTKIIGILLISIGLFLTWEASNSVYMNVIKKVVTNPSEEKTYRFSEVDGLGVLIEFKEDKKWFNLPSHILIFLTSVYVAGLLFILIPSKVLMKSFQVIKLTKFIVNFLIFLLLYFMIITSIRGPLIFTDDFNATTFFVIGFFLLIVLVFIISNGAIPKLLRHKSLILWIILFVIVLGNGLLIHNYSTTYPNHEGNYLDHDFLNIALYAGSKHNWNFSYSLFRGMNIVLIFFSILFLSVIISSSRKQANSSQTK